MTRLFSHLFFIAASSLIPPFALATALPVAPATVSALLSNASGATSAPPSAKKGVVVVYLSARCPCSASHEPVLRDLHAKYASKGFSFVGLHANQDEPATETESHFEASKLPFPILRDEKARLANAMGALKTPHAFLYSPDGILLYSGGVDDSRAPERVERRYLDDALAAVSEGKAPPEKEARALGCTIKR